MHAAVDVKTRGRSSQLSDLSRMTPLQHSRWLCGLLWALLPPETQAEVEPGIRKEAPWLAAFEPEDDEQPYVSTKDAAELLGVTSGTIRKWAHQRRLKRVNRGGHEAYYSVSDVRAMAT
jgi:excisionase family DNA binding protein